MRCCVDARYFVGIVTANKQGEQERVNKVVNFEPGPLRRTSAEDSDAFTLHAMGSKPVMPIRGNP